MIEPRLRVRSVLDGLNREALPVRDAQDESARRRRIAAAIDDRLGGVAETHARQGERNRRLAWAVAAALLLVMGVAGVTFGHHPGGQTVTSRIVATLQSETGSVEVLRGERNARVEGPMPLPLETADEIETRADARATAVLASGAVVDVHEGTSVRFESRAAGPDSSAAGGEDLRLSSGTVALVVPKLGPHRTLTVQTPDSAVTVRGTRFEVTVFQAADRLATRVSVTEGSVWVTSRGREILVRPGAEWSSVAEDAAAVAPSVQNAAPAEPSSPERRDRTLPSAAREGATGAAHEGATGAAQHEGATGAAHEGATSATHEGSRSTLASENELYQQAVAAARRGDDAGAIAQLEAFLIRFPGSPLAQNAKVERLRALARVGRPDQEGHAGGPP